MPEGGRTLKEMQVFDLLRQPAMLLRRSDGTLIWANDVLRRWMGSPAPSRVTLDPAKPVDHGSGHVTLECDGRRLLLMCDFSLVEIEEEGEATLAVGHLPPGQAEVLFRTVLEKMPRTIFLMGVRGDGLAGFDGGVQEVLGVDAERMTGLPRDQARDVARWHSHVHPGDLSAYLAAQERRRQTGAGYVVEYRIAHGQTGEMRWLRETAWTVANPTEDRVLLGAYVLDVTEEKHNEQRLLQAMQASEQANRSKADFLAKFSHELRTPLNAILGFSEVIKEGLLGPVDPPNYAEYAADIFTSGSHLLDLINDILELTRLEAGAFTLQEEVIDVADLVRTTVRSVDLFARNREVAIDWKFMPALPALLGDRRAIRQILLNLVSNGVKFTPAGGHVRVRAGLTSDNRIAITVTDTGIGMTEEEIPIALREFGQVKNRHTQSLQGTGLGLPIAKALAEQHGGSLSIDSIPGRGTTVTVRMPPERTCPVLANPCS